MEAGGVRGARGVLINITGSSRLGLHEVNEACKLIRQAAQNEDVQINFGVVMNEAMGEEVKITVIATGFERENLPAIERKSSRVAAAAPVAQPMAQPEPSPQMEIPAPEPMFAEAAEPVMPGMPEPVDEEPQMTMSASAVANGHDALFDDLDVPAILRRDRRNIQ
jgi:cell division protein FtsZ